MKNSEQPAGPTIDCADGHWADPKTCTRWVPHHGLSKREYFAGLAMQGLLASGPHDCDEHGLAHDALLNADALLAQLERSAKDE